MESRPVLSNYLWVPKGLIGKAPTLWAPDWEHEIELLKTPEGRIKQQQIAVLKQQAEASGLDPDEFISDLTNNDKLLVKSWSEVGDWWALCAGDMTKVRALCRQMKWDIKDRRSEVPWPEDLSGLSMVMKPKPNQVAPFHEWVKAGHGIFKAAPAFGKAQPVDEVVLTPQGWRPLGSIKVGDYVIGSTGQPVRVTGVFPQGHRPVRVIRFSDGALVRADVDHLWAVKSSSDLQDRPWRILTTGEMEADLYDPEGEARWRVPLVEVQGVEQPLPLDPYVLGVLLGDGCLKHLLSPTFTSVNEEIVQRVNDRLPDFGKGRASVVKEALKALQLWGCLSDSKFIPPLYLAGSVEQRRALLAGLMDTDGWDHDGWDHGQLSTASKQLALDVVQLARSLGGTARFSRRRRGKTAYMVTMKMPFTPFALERKKLAYESHPRTPPCRKVVAIEDGGTADCVCISVEAPDSLYVTKDYVVTHNTYIMCWLITTLRQRTLLLTHTDQLAEQFITRFRHGSPKSDGSGFVPVTNCIDIEQSTGTEIIGRYRSPDKIWPVTVATWQSFISPGGRKALKVLKESFGLVLCDEAHVFAAPAPASVVNGFAAKQKRGVTATPSRKDKLDVALYDIVGQVTAEGKSEQLPVAGYMISTGVAYKGRSFPGMGDWPRILNFLYKHASRNDQIVSWLRHDTSLGRKVLVLAERRAWSLEMAELLRKEYDIAAKAIVGGIDGRKRDAIISEMTSGELQVLFATTKIAREGLDIPVLDTLYATMPLANKSGLEQMLGRERRPHPAKVPPVVFRYFVDEGHGILYGCAKSTHKSLLDEGADVVLVPYGRKPNEVKFVGHGTDDADEDGGIGAAIARRKTLKAAGARAPTATQKLFSDLDHEAKIRRQYQERMKAGSQP